MIDRKVQLEYLLNNSKEKLAEMYLDSCDQTSSALRRIAKLENEVEELKESLRCAWAGEHG